MASPHLLPWSGQNPDYFQKSEMDGSPNNDLVGDDDDNNPSVVGAMMAETGHPIIRINAQLDQLDIHRRSYINTISLL